MFQRIKTAALAFFALLAVSSAKEEDDAIWKIEQADRKLVIRLDKYSRWYLKEQKEEVPYFYFSGPSGQISHYPLSMGAIVGFLQEGLALQARKKLTEGETGGPQITFLETGGVELQFGKESKPECAIQLSRKEALELVKVVQGRLQRLIEFREDKKPD